MISFHAVVRVLLNHMPRGRDEAVDHPRAIRDSCHLDSDVIPATERACPSSASETPSK